MISFLRPLLILIILQVTVSVHAADPEAYQWLQANPTPQWIWTKAAATDGQKLVFTQQFELDAAVEEARLYSTCDNKMTLFINDKKAGSSNEWQSPLLAQPKKFLKEGLNQIRIEAQNEGGVAALVLKLQVVQANGKVVTVTTTPEWKAVSPSNPGEVLELEYKGKLGIPPWGVPGLTTQSSGGSSSPLDSDLITVPDGFEVELLYAVPKDAEGSWVSLTVGPNEGLYACDQGNKGLFQVQVSDQGNVTVQKVPVDLSGAQGLYWAFDGLYFNKNGGHLHKITDSNGDGTLDAVEQLPSSNGGGEHGNHAVQLTEDEQQLYIVGGNHANLPETATSRVPTWDEDLLLPRQWDARGHARGRLAPGGWVTRFDPVKKTHDLYCIGFRNEYDVALNFRGDLFTYDADMEWDMGMPWYRPTRICQVVSGADYGWRSGTGKWPTYYEDSLPPVVDIGPGSPTGVASGIGARFPVKYQQAIYALDWTFGTIYAIHLKENGAGYTGESEPFCYGAPLPVTDAVVGRDGHFYFTTGGRGTQSALYRIKYTGSEPSNVDLVRELTHNQARETRRMLEQYHGKKDRNAVDAAWPHLGSEDRFLRHAARIAVESQPFTQWSKKVYDEPDPQTRITAAVALARHGCAQLRNRLAGCLLELDETSLSDQQILGLLRAYALSFIRIGYPDNEIKQEIVNELHTLLPHQNKDVNVELIRVLVALKDPGVIEKALTLIETEGPDDLPEWSELITRNANYGGTIKTMLDNHPPLQKIQYAFLLRNLRNGWTIEQRRRYFTFLNSNAQYSGGASYPGFLTNIREEALGNCSNDERAALVDLTGEDFNPVPDFEITEPKGPGREWTLEDALRTANRGQFPNASFENGRNLFFATNCGKCHRFAGLGGGVGPDLTSIKNKFDAHYLIESIIDPSKIISDQYSSSTVLLLSGKSVNGIVVEQGENTLIYPTDPKGEPLKVNEDDIEEIVPSRTSQMPLKLIDKLNEQELQDLIAYLLSGGDPNSKVYGK